MPQGINDANVTAWFQHHIDGLEPPLAYELIAGGHSNLTYRVTDTTGKAWVLRRPPLHQVLATAHDMNREHKVISALATSAVPVPAVLGLCTDEAVNDRPFYVMDFVDGSVLRTSTEAEAFPLLSRRRAAQSLIEVLASLHALDPEDVGLGDLGKKQDYVARQLRRWLGQYEKSATSDRPEVAAIHDHLVSRIPDQHRAGIVHGDYRLDNCIVNDDGTVAAVLDWELCTLGDTNVDVAQLLTYWAEPGDTQSALADPPTGAPGFPTRDEVLATYQAVSGRDLSGIDYYLAFAHWKLACILEGVYSRYVGGAMGDRNPTGGAEAFVTQIDTLLQNAAEAAERVP